jgi:hypothetical protein
MRTIKDQVIASTTTDVFGDELSESELRELFEQMPPVSWMNDEHDLSRAPVAKGYNKRFVRLGDGACAVIADVDVLNEEKFGQCGGFSISWVFKTVRIGSKAQPDISIIFNPRVVDEDFVLEAVAYTDETIQVDGVEIKQRAATAAAVTLVIAFAAREIAAGFFKQAGADAYSKLKEWIHTLGATRARQNLPTIVQCTFPVKLNTRPIEVRLVFNESDWSLVHRPEASDDALLSFLRESVGEKKVTRVVLRPQEAAPYWAMLQIIEDCDKGNR